MVEYFLRPVQLLVVSYDDHSLAAVPDGFDSALSQTGSPIKSASKICRPSYTTASTRCRRPRRLNASTPTLPGGASNNGESVNLFVQRGIEAVRNRGEGVIVIADDEELDWPQEVLYQVQSFASQRGFFVSRMMPRLHAYHLDDAPDLHSCNLIIKSRPEQKCHRPMSYIFCKNTFIK